MISLNHQKIRARTEIALSTGIRDLANWLRRLGLRVGISRLPPYCATAFRSLKAIRVKIDFALFAIRELPPR